MASGHLEFLCPDHSPPRVFKIGITGEGAHRGDSEVETVLFKVQLVSAELGVFCSLPGNV